MKVSDLKVGDQYYSIHVQQQFPKYTDKALRDGATPKKPVLNHYIDVVYEVLSAPQPPVMMLDLLVSKVIVKFDGKELTEMVYIPKEFAPTAYEPDLWLQAPVTHFYKTKEELAARHEVLKAANGTAAFAKT